ncbi:MAG: hypothetical protein ICV87_11590 [Gemmatimonadetes bacterium]|nr:hypothetical protein [Gemmatimonadota bacterium]
MTHEPTPATTPCAHCAHADFRWRIKRVRMPGSAPSLRTIVWTCRGCGAEREEAVEPRGARHEAMVPRPR